MVGVSRGKIGINFKVMFLEQIFDEKKESLESLSPSIFPQVFI
jgi:hypothetical protein